MARSGIRRSRLRFGILWWSVSKTDPSHPHPIILATSLYAPPSLSLSLRSQSQTKPTPSISKSPFPNPKRSQKQTHLLTFPPTHTHHHPTLSLPTGAPDALQQPIALGEAVHAVVALAHGAHEAAQRVRHVLARVSPALVHLADAELHARVVLGRDDSVRR